MRILTALLAATLSSVLTAKDITIAVIPKGTTHVFWKSVHAGAEKAAKEESVKIFWNGPAREGNREGQIQVIEDFLSRKVSAVVLAPLDDTALVPSVNRLAKASIPVVIIDSGIKTENIASFVATDNYAGGAIAARRMGKILGGKGAVAVVQYMAGSDSTTKREKGFMETLKKEFPGIAIVDAKYGLDTPETALSTAEDILTKNKKLDGIFACNESTAVGTLRALESRGRTSVKFVGFDSSDPLVSGVKRGVIDSLVVQNPFAMGYEGVKAAVAVIKGGKPKARIDTGVMLVTKDNLDSAGVRTLLGTK